MWFQSRGKGNKGEIENYKLCGFSLQERGTREQLRTTNFVVSVKRRGEEIAINEGKNMLKRGNVV